MQPRGSRRRPPTAPAQDTGNMELLSPFWTEEQKEQWLYPLLDGTIRSILDDVARGRVLRRDQHRDVHRTGRRPLRDQRTQVVDLRRDVAAVHPADRDGLTDPDAERHRRQSIILVPKDAPGMTGLRSTSIFGYDDRPHGGHADVIDDNVRGPGVKPARRGTGRVQDRAGAHRAGAHPPRHARDRHRRAGARNDVRADGLEGDVRQTDHPARRCPALDLGSASADRAG